MQIFYTPDIATGATHYTLTEEESKHAIRVLRLQQGDSLTLVDGRGGLYTASILDSHPKKTLLVITDTKQEYCKRGHYLHIAVAPTKNIERIEWFLEKATEIGIDEISLLLCQRSERKEAKAERLDKIITSAVKQSLKAYHPQLNAVQPFTKLIDQPFEGQKFIAHCLPGKDKVSLASRLVPKGRCLILIGPEGDFTEKEIADALKNGFEPITLGESRLRTETAALEACFEVNFLNR
ncbi:16S rRNA (uracil(1498)-N(3))-methyltransferase [Mucilaginibacter daejeonensis]|uniref:16S rRNA (uracil(1498)-N(3))-methyltransferase n=1 Tax=Mucilaginibacter daejeonensis TaxID=398049 RepID=UPI001D172F54|nr:16S rRNA (uracil(1498)-N(3))-methyltransferase [Mucilaginibacter daejeonensis]UEG52894.1 16S rRNA (uracil(1498)-N(3))-methyltransferase [Mucilaginibacter daejeonensis]